MDACDLIYSLRSTFFPRDRDIETQPDRGITVGSGGDITVTSGDITINSGDIIINAGDIIGPGGGTIAVPDGPIVLMHAGSVASIASGWQLADGTNGTVDLTDLFVVGAGGSYSPGDTGGADTVDISHTHADTFSVDSDSHSHADTFSVDNDTHNHNSGTLSTDSDSHSHTMPGASVVIGNESSHTHSISSDGSHSHGLAGPAPDIPNTGSQYPPSTATEGSHDHSGTSGSGSAHNHSITGTTNSHNHSHDVDSGSTANDTHNHNLSGSVSSDSHSHVLSGSVSSGGDTTHDNRPSYYALCFIMRPV